MTKIESYPVVEMAKCFKEHGIAIKLPTIGHHEVDCPKEFCKKARKGDNKKCLKVDVLTPDYSTWKCHHCLWTGHFGEPENKTIPKIEKTLPPIPSNPTTLDHTLPIIFAQTEADRDIILGVGFKNVVFLKENSDLPGLAETILKCSKFIIAFDNTPEGEKLRYELARRVGAAKCWNVNYTETTLAETLKLKGTDWVCEDINMAKPYPITGLYNVSDFEASLIKYFEGGMASGVSTGWTNVDRYYTVMPCEMTVVTGVPNNGKSEWLDALAVNLCLADGWRFAVFSPENGKEQHVVKLVEKRVEMSASPKLPDRMSLDTFLSGSAWVAEHFFFIVGDDEKDLPTLDWIMARAADAILRYGVKGLIIDPWNEIEHQRSSTVSETEYVSQALSKLKRFARNHGIHLWVIAHPNKMLTGKDGKIAVPSLYDISGSANWANKADNGIVVHRSDDIADATEIWVKKVRFKHVGRRGMTTLKYNKTTGRYSLPDGGDDAIYSQGGGEEIQTYEANHGY